MCLQIGLCCDLFQPGRQGGGVHHQNICQWHKLADNVKVDCGDEGISPSANLRPRFPRPAQAPSRKLRAPSVCAVSRNIIFCITRPGFSTSFWCSFEKGSSLVSQGTVISQPDVDKKTHSHNRSFHHHHHHHLYHHHHSLTHTPLRKSQSCGRYRPSMGIGRAIDGAPEGLSTSKEPAPRLHDTTWLTTGIVSYKRPALMLGIARRTRYRRR